MRGFAVASWSRRCKTAVANLIPRGEALGERRTMRDDNQDDAFPAVEVDEKRSDVSGRRAIEVRPSVRHTGAAAASG